jgi:UDP-N-acetylglucosamine 2-epimerase (non-hydrolysing)
MSPASSETPIRLKNLLVPFGTRPEIVKLAPVVAALRAHGFGLTTAATGQHFDAALTDVFYEELGIRPDFVKVLSGSPAERLGALHSGAVEIVSEVQPDLVLLLGDTNTIPAFCLASRAARIPLAHLEAGMRSFNQTSIEEVNRKVAAVAASIHLAPTELAADFLKREGVPAERVHVVGNPVIDVLREKGVRARPVEERSGAVVTAHRATNVDDAGRLAELARMLEGLARLIPPVVFPVHPRTRSRLEAAGFMDTLRRVEGLRLVDPLPYREMLDALAAASVVVTDSGGLQEEASYLGLPAVVLRHSTPRWEGISAGASILTGMNSERALAAVRRLSAPEEQHRVAALPCPYGDGTTGRRVAQLLAAPEIDRLLEIDEPNFVGKAPPA